MNKNYVELYISTEGNDRNIGSIAMPFLTLSRARDEIRRLKKVRENTMFHVWIRGGYYALHETLTFNLDDSGSEECPIIYEAYPGETPVIGSRIVLSNWKKVRREDCPSELPTEVLDHIWCADLPVIPNHSGKFYTLFEGSRRIPRAIGEGFAPTNEFEEMTFVGPAVDHETIHFPHGAIRQYSNFSDVEVVVRPTAAWSINILPLQSVDLTTNTAITAIPALYHIGKLYTWGDRSKSIWVENIFEGMTQPDSWVTDSHAGKIYYWPNGDKPSESVYLTGLRELIRVEGDIDFDGNQDTPVQHIQFRGITFMHGERDVWEHDYRVKGLQHAWDQYDKGNSLVRLRGAEHCVIEKCRFMGGGGGGLRLDLHCQHNRVEGNEFSHLGGTGLLLAGYGPGTKDANRDNVISNNHIHHIGEILWHAPGIFVWQSGRNQISNNLLHALPYTAIVVSGRIDFANEDGECSKTIRWHEIGELPEMKDSLAPEYYSIAPFLHGKHNVIERNEIYDIETVLADGNGIYISGTGQFNIVRENYVHHIETPHGSESIRCDDLQHDTLIEKNVIYRQGGMGSGITSKGINHIINNFIIDPATDQTARGMITLELAPVTGSRIERNVLLATQKKHIAYYQERLYGNGGIPRLKDTNADRNLYFNRVDPLWGDRHLAQERIHGIEGNSLSEDPQFYSIEHEDFRFLLNSPAWRMGIESLDISKAGLLDNFEYADVEEPIRRLDVRCGGNLSSFQFIPGQAAQLEVSARSLTGFRRSDPELEYISLDPSITVVDDKGAIIAGSPGETEIRVSTVNQNELISSRIIVIVKADL